MPQKMLTDDEFETAKEIFKKHMPDTANDSDLIAERIRDLDEAIILISQVWLDRPLGKRKEHLGIAVLARNFLARYIGQPEIETPTLVPAPSMATEEDSAKDTKTPVAA